MRRILSIYIIITLFFIIFNTSVFANSDYVLPYPSFMPGSSFYKPHLIWEKIMRFWYFGNFGKFTYNLKQSDKYLIEGKTLLEYKQYKLGIDSLKESNKFFLKAYKNLLDAKKENKDIKEKEFLLKEALQKHVEILSFLKEISPDKYLWNPEKSSPTELPLHKILDQASFELKNL